MACVFERRWHAGRISRREKYLCRLACCAPPFACAFAFPSLAKALAFTGVVGILLPFLVTPLLHHVSRVQAQRRWGRAPFAAAEDRAGHHLGALSSPIANAALGALGALLLAFCTVCGLLYGF